MAYDEGNKMTPYYETELGTLYHGDCLEVMKELEAESIDLVLTDPPYGIKRDKGFEGFGGFGKKIARRQFEGDWDNDRPSKEYFEAILKIGKLSMIFGGNFFADILPQSKHWLVWDKLNTMPTFGDCELIWTNSKRNSVKKYILEWNGLLGKEETREHPTQKPIKLLYMILRDYSKDTDLILDPFLGSGTTAVACERLGRKWIGIEISKEYCDIAVKRIEAERAQRKLF